MSEEQMEFEDILNAAVDAGWGYRTTLPKGSFSGSCRAAGKTAIELYRRHLEHGLLLEAALAIVRRAGYHILSLEALERHQKLLEEREQLRSKLERAEVAIGEVLALMQNKEHLRKRFRKDAHWIRFIRDARLLLQGA